MDDKPIRILLVEDEHEYARLMRRMLASVKKIVPVTPRFDLEWVDQLSTCLLYTSPSPRDRTRSRMPSSA